MAQLWQDDQGAEKLLTSCWPVTSSAETRKALAVCKLAAFRVQAKQGMTRLGRCTWRFAFRQDPTHPGVLPENFDSFPECGARGEPCTTPK